MRLVAFSGGRMLCVDRPSRFCCSSRVLPDLSNLRVGDCVLTGLLDGDFVCLGRLPVTEDLGWATLLSSVGNGLKRLDLLVGDCVLSGLLSGDFVCLER